MTSTPQSLANQRGSTKLVDQLAAVLPHGRKFGVYHLTTPPTRTDPLCSAPPGAHPDRTYCESHFLAVTIDLPSKTSSPPRTTDRPVSPTHDGCPTSTEVLVLGLEVFIFTTAYSSTFFVSKADSTGFLRLLHLPKGTSSPIREIATTFLSYLVTRRRRQNIRSVVSLFARAQDQYLFPGSIEYSGKHVLDDRGLIKWWCRVLDPLLEPHHDHTTLRPDRWDNVKGYLVVPGLDNYESRAFIPRASSATARWALGHPLERLSHFTEEHGQVPPRCLIPHFPDDPKSRFRDELDQEAANWSEYKDQGFWRSVKSLEQFWEMMAFRQECSGGHMTGFIWIVFDPPATRDRATSALPTPGASFNGSQVTIVPSSPPRQADHDPTTPRSSPLKPRTSPQSSHTSPSKTIAKPPASSKRKKTVLKGPIRSRQPRVKTQARNYVPDIPITTSYYHWPPEGRGARVVTEADYKRCTELLLRLDFATLELSQGSTSRWVNEVGGGIKWKQEVTGSNSGRSAVVTHDSSSVVITTTLIPKKRPADKESGIAQSAAVTGESTAVHILSTGLVRKKRKDNDGYGEPAANASGSIPSTNVNNVDGNQSHASASTVNVLGSVLVRKKPRVA